LPATDKAIARAIESHLIEQVRTDKEPITPEIDELEETGLIHKAMQELTATEEREKIFRSIASLGDFVGYEVDMKSIQAWTKVLTIKALGTRHKGDTEIQEAISSMFNELGFEFCFKDSK